MNSTYFDRFDIVNAYHAFYSSHYNSMHSAYYKRLSKIKQYGRNLANSFEELETENARCIYSNLCDASISDYYARELEREYDELLNELYPIKIGYASFYASDVLRELDPIMYRQGLIDYSDSEVSEGRYPECVFDEL